LQVTRPIKRCRAINVHPDGEGSEINLLQWLARDMKVPFLGVYAYPITGGRIRINEEAKKGDVNCVEFYQSIEEINVFPPVPAKVENGIFESEYLDGISSHIEWYKVKVDKQLRYEPLDLDQADDDFFIAGKIRA
jgi:hypothetical protein